MKIQFSADLDYQAEAIASIVDVFQGQEICRTNFTVAASTDHPQMDLALDGENGDLGIGNRLRLLHEDILENVRAVQLRNGLAPSAALDGMNFTVEMETGTGKTYVYLRTIFELHRAYGFTKFIIVVPSVAIKEGVYKSLQMTEEHFRGLYENVQLDYFVYDSQKLGQVRSFATSDTIQVMVINIDAFRKSFEDPSKEDKANIIHRPHDRMTGSRPIEFLQATNPIVIIDEPQSVDTTPKSRQAIASLNPLCTLRYSATHVDRHNMLFRLDSVDAYERKLVKQIEVAGIEVEDGYNRAYVKLLAVDNRHGGVRARIGLDRLQKGGSVARTAKWVRSGDDLLDLSGGRSVYDGYIIEEIYCGEGSEYISFTSKPEVVRLHQAIGEVDDDHYKRLQIRKTVQTHLQKELLLRPKGIKVLSLFFLDRVANYREYDEEGNPQPGKYARMFEEEYAAEIKKPKYDSLFAEIDRETAVEGLHDGYFAADKKKVGGRSVTLFKESRGAGTTAADEDAYALIMRDKERLLSFDSKLKFIFSHSALREGWDNPNVFQICTLNETGSVMKKRQEIGRGLRIAVNQAGERVHGFEVNRLTVMANESYQRFAEQLQREIEADTGIRFGLVEAHLFANIPVTDAHGETAYLGMDASRTLWGHLQDKGYIDSKGNVQDALKSALKQNAVELPAEFTDQAEQIQAILRKVAGNLNVRNADDRRAVKLNKAVFLGDDFKQLWERIKYRTTFRVEFDPEQLIETCAAEIRDNLKVGKARFVTRTARIDIDRGGVAAEEIQESVAVLDGRDWELPDVVGYLQNETNLTRRSIVEIMIRSGRLTDFKDNPQKYIEQIAAVIKRQMRLFIVDGIQYRRIGDQDCYAQELFEQNALFGYLSKNMIASAKSVYDHVVYDSEVEEAFARSFEQSEEVKVFAKLPGWFKIDTPLGSYNPDWAVLVDLDGQERLFFVVESKGSLFSDALRPIEQGKIDCGKAHFAALGTDVAFTVANNYSSFSSELTASG
ncbi:type III restriction-modification system endonuclease [Thiocapsa sp.]|uniref:type III restriction-modification system endonuclease n=1 Tax=Thiocapsa sp. TaxID=2024551 RepID=UPI002C9288C1|nr:DEAD/DEAH box helicase family protein [Thiocapsa sp.]HSO82538.1 DEAD/DEAH box helicase family protein [Thiocapsa sp.]